MVISNDPADRELDSSAPALVGVTTSQSAILGAARLAVAIESLLFVSGEPIEIARLAEVLEVERGEVEAGLVRLANDCQARGVRVQRLDEMVQLVTAPECAGSVSRFLGAQAPSRLSAAALETLAIIAYRQPVTRARIEAVRGVGSERALTSLIARNLIAEVGRAETIGRPVLFGTTHDFLDYFGLTSLAELPTLDLVVDSPTG